MSSFQILNRQSRPGVTSGEPDIVRFRPAAAPVSRMPLDEVVAREPVLPPVVLRLNELAPQSRSWPRIALDVRTHGSWALLGMGALVATWLIFGGKRPEPRPVDEAPSWTPPVATSTTAPAIQQPLAAETAPAAEPPMPSAAPPAPSAAAPSAEAPAAPQFEQPPAVDQGPSLPPPTEPGAEDSAIRARATQIRTARAEGDTRLDGGAPSAAPGEAAPLGITTEAPQ